jgi:hypothetical protein
MKNKRRIIAAVQLILSIGFFLLASCGPDYTYTREKFSRDKWINNKSERYTMSEDIIQSKMLIGKTKEEVKELLGEDTHLDNDNSVEYVLGIVPRFTNVDPDVLLITFEDGKVAKVKQYES